jgi:acetoin utilization deacetylase AcuC-like enzyme
MAFYSVHLHPDFPGTGGANAGDNCFNFPVPPQTPRDGYLRTLARALDELKKFDPALVGVSAGFDAYKRDPLADGVLDVEDFHWLGAAIRGLGVPAFSVLEGGYSGRLPELVFAYLNGLCGK